MDASNYVGSKNGNEKTYLSAKDGDLKGPVRVQIDRVEESPFKYDDGTVKLALFFEGKSLGLVLNKSKTKILMKEFGKDTDDWVGCLIDIRPDKTDFAGNLVDCFTVSIPMPEDADEVPF